MAFLAALAGGAGSALGGLGSAAAGAAGTAGSALASGAGALGSGIASTAGSTLSGLGALAKAAGGGSAPSGAVAAPAAAGLGGGVTAGATAPGTVAPTAPGGGLGLLAVQAAEKAGQSGAGISPVTFGEFALDQIKKNPSGESLIPIGLEGVNRAANLGISPQGIQALSNFLQSRAQAARLRNQQQRRLLLG